MNRTPADTWHSGSHFTLSRRDGGWTLIAPDGQPFFSVGLNHFDSAGLRHPDNIELWHGRYANSQQQWLQSVRENLLAWGFNTVGWVQEVVTIGPTCHRHSRNFTFEEYQWLGMPYCHMLPFTDFHQWDHETRLPDLFSREWETWCDYVAREHCGRMADDPKLIGYWYLDCPTWVHTTEGNRWRGPMFDAQRLQSENGRRELLRLAARYYQVTHEAVRRYDRSHLILGDRYEANAPLPVEVVEAARPFVDVLCFQDFEDPVAHLDDWHRRTGMPVVWADGCKCIGLPSGDDRNDGRAYAGWLDGLAANRGCIGAHLCGAYLRNRVRRRGLLDDRERPDEEMIGIIAAANRRAVRARDQEAPS